MANTKVTRRFFYACFSIFLLLLMMVSSPGYSAITNPSVALTSDVNGDGIAGIGDTVTITCKSDTASGAVYVSSLQSLGFTQLLLVPMGSNRYSAIYTVSAGNINSQITFIFDDDSGSTQSVTSTFVLNNKRPSANSRPTTNRGSCSDGTFKKNDTLVITHKLNSSNNGETMYADLSALGLGYVDMGATGDTFTCSVTMPANKEGTNLSFPVTATNAAGNSVTWTSAAINYDTIAPVIQSATAVNLTSNKQYVTVGDSIKIQAVVSKWDNDILVASNSLLFPGGPVTMEKVSGDTIGASAVYEYTHYVTEEQIPNSSVCFEIIAKDDAENETKKSTNFIKLDTLPPEFSTLSIKITEPVKGILSNVAIINDNISIYGDMSSIMTDVSLFVDLSSIGGVTNQIIPFADGSTAPRVGTTSFLLNYTVGQYTSEDNIPRAFTVTAKDIAGNIITQVTMPVIYVDNYPPTISAGSFSNITTPGQPVKLGDQIAITAVVGNPDDGTIYADISKLGGSNKAELSLYSGSTYRLDHIVAESTDPMLLGPIDQSVSFVVYAQDNAGNTVYTTTGNLLVDTEPPQILNATFTVSPALSASHKYVKAGDILTFKVQLASSASSIHDNESVTMDLSAFTGQSATTELVYGGGWYTYTFEVPAGSLNYETNFSAVAKDNAGNTVSRGIQVKIDNSKPVVGPIGVNFLSDNPKTGVINIGDRIEIIVPVDDADEGYCYMDLSIIGSSSSCIIPYDKFDTALNRYYLVVDCNDASVENPSYVFTANVYDKAGNKMSGISSPYVVDCVRPICNNFTVTHISKKGKSNVINVGDQVKFTVDVDPSTFDHASVTVNLTKLGGPVAQKLEDMGDNQWSYTYTVEEGTTDGEDVLFKVKITDDAGNFVETNAPKTFFVDNCPVKINSMTYTQTTDTNGNGIVDLDGTFVVEPVYATDSVTLTINLSDNASVTVDVTKFGYGDTASSVPVISSVGGYKAEVVIYPKKGSTNNEPVALTVTVTDSNGNQTIETTSNTINVDNKPPEIIVSPVTFTYDTGRKGEANKNDVIKIEANVTGNDGLSPLLDFTALFAANNMEPPGGTIMENTAGSNKYSATFTVPEGLLSKNKLAIIAKDSSGNMSVGETTEIRFISKIPTVNSPSVSIIDDVNSNGILNPGDTVRISCSLDGAFEDNNTPPTRVVIDIGGITDSDSNAFYTGEVENPEKRCWVELSWDGDINNPYLYTGEFVASATVKANRGTDADSIDFMIRVLHPDSNTETMFTTTVTGQFPVDTKIPLIVNSSTKLSILEENNDNITSYTANIGDLMEVKTEIKYFDDFASATAILYMPNNGEVLGYVPLVRSTGTDYWIGEFNVATGTRKTGEEVGENEWRLINEEQVKLKIYATDDADNTASSSLITPSPAIKMDNKPPQISTYHTETYIDRVDINADGWSGLNVWNGLATDSIFVKVTLTEAINATQGKGYAYIDLSPIGATSTYLLKPTSGANCSVFITEAATTFTDRYTNYIATSEVDLGSYSFRIYVVDGAGNRNYFEDPNYKLAIDTKRPSIESVTYDGAMVTIKFSETIQPTTIDVDNIRIGRSNVSGVMSLHKNVDVAQGTAVSLSSTPVSEDPEDYDKISPITYNTDTLYIMLGKTSKGKIADWGETKLFLSIASMDDEPGQITETTDTNYNPITSTTSYYERPNLTGGNYNAASTNIDGEYLHLTFDKSMDKTTLTEESISKLAIWYNTSSQSELWNIRYRMRPGSDTFDLGDAYNTSSCNANSLGIKLSQEAKDWIALTYGNRASQMRLQVSDSEYDPPPFIRDINGNRINTILPGYAVAASLTPLTTPYSITSDVSLDLSSSTPILTIHFNNRRARLFQDTYSATSLTISKTMPADLSRIYICSEERVSSGQNICLGTSGTVPAMVNWNSGLNSYTALNDFASTTVRIPLTDTALNNILTWGTSKFYLRCENGAFTDLWGNLSEPFADSNNNGAPLHTTMPSDGDYADPKIYSVALTPVTEGMAGRTLFKGYAANTFMYEVSFETATLSSNIRVPISRAITPTLRLYTQNGDNLLDTGTFVEWGEHNQGGVTRTYIRFANSGLSETGTFQREPVYIKVEGFTDIFRPTLSYVDTASFAYDLTKKMEGTSYPLGFNQVASYPMEFDNNAPLVLTATSTLSGIPPINNVVGVTAKNNMKVTITFNEDMYQSTNTSAMPSLKLVTSAGSTVMTFTFSRWINSTQAEFLNTAAFDSTTTQGRAYFNVKGGYDEAGNALSEVTLLDYVDIRSKGPTINNISVKTLQYTTANSADDYQTDVAYSPSVSSNYYEDTITYPNGIGEGLGIATITFTFDTPPEGDTGEVRIYTIDGATLVRRLPALQASSATEWYAEWDGRRDDGTLITSNYQITYIIKFYDEAGNEGSRNGQIIYDNAAPKVVEWQFQNLKTVNNVAYFSPSVQTSARINVITGDLGQTMKMRLSRKNPDPDQHDIVNTYVMSSYGNSGYTIAFDGNGSVNTSEVLSGSWTVDLVDTAGNLGIPLNSSSKATATIIIDRTGPTITNIILQKVTSDNTPVGDPGVDRFNARLHNLKIMITDATVADDPLDDGTGIVKIMSGSTLIREIYTVKTGSDLYAIWDGKDDNGVDIPDGTYTIKVTDLAGNESTLTKEITLIRSVFALTGVEQVGLDSIKMVFSQAVEPTTIGAAYTISPVNPAGLQISNATLSTSDPTIVMASITPALTVSQHQIQYTVTVPPDTVKSIDGDSITAGNNSAKFTADTRGPVISAITYDGLSSQKQFNVVFDEQIESASAISVANYKLAKGSSEVPITSITLRTDSKSVTITSASDIEEGINYTLTIKNVKDLAGNKSDTTVTFEGRDITPPVLIVTAFSTPTNERDIIIAVKSNEDISGLPTAIISQTGNVANSIQLAATGNNRIFTGGYHLDPNYAGVATIKVTASDLSNNEGTANYSFTTAYVSASSRASITSADRIATVVFEKGSLKSNSTVMLLTEKLVKIENASETVRASIIPAVMEGMNVETRTSLRANIEMDTAADKAVQELVPLSEGYKLIVPSNRLAKSVKISFKLNNEQLANQNIALYECSNNSWKMLNTTTASGTATFTTKDGSLFAVMQDKMAPRASIENDLKKVIKTAKPVFTWNIEEYASGLDKNSVKAVMDGKEYDVILSTDGTVAKFTPTNLNSGEHDIGLNISDLAGNRASIASGRFQAVLPLVIEDVSSYPNPARNYSKIRFKVSGNTINADEVSVKIYDVAGHLVADGRNIDMRGAKANIYEARWDLCNKKGKKVANGAYIARIEVRDPNNWGKKAKFTLKIAVLK